jgi:hypothetical protein
MDNPINFSRFKRKSLILVCNMSFLTNLSFFLIKIKNKKLNELIHGKNLSSLVMERSLAGHTEAISCIVKLNENQIASGSGDNLSKFGNYLVEFA